MFPSKQKSIKSLFSTEGVKKVGKTISKFFLFNAIPFNAADSGPYYQSMIDTIAEAGPGIKGPTGYQIRNTYLEKEVQELEVGEENVVQVVTDNEASFKAAGMLLMEKRKHLFWSPCAAHCIDLMLEDIGSMKHRSSNEKSIGKSLIEGGEVNCTDICMLQHFSNHPEIKVGLKEVIKRLEPDLDRQAKAINEVKLFVDGQREFGSALTKKAINQSLPTEWWNNYGDEGPHLQKIAVKILSQTCSSSGCERNWSTCSLIHTKLRNRLAMKKLHKLVYVHYNMRLRVKNLMQERSNEDLYNPIDLNHIFNDDDILDEWIREGEEPILSSDNLDWLDKGLPTNEEGRERDVDSRRKGKASRTISSSSSSDDGDNRGSRRGGGTSGGNRGVGGTSEGIGEDGSTGGGYVSQVDPGMSWAQGAGVDPEQPSKPYFPDYGSSSQSSHPPYLSYEPLFQSYPHYGNCHPNLYAHRRTDDDDDFEPPRHST
ncbi:hypothetical protein CK203_046848 [Vitis vinifera]|uniref:HAT C-terminal dimerisation domain-containing protein n=1 Tax=Vitis vinifera TaxID=29760 RepID=A0A438HYC4_VITVI|nr:hypothetical protein CK203_046848 [Vitis vinifera]